VSVHAELNDMKDMQLIERQIVSQFTKLASLDCHQHHLTPALHRQLTDLRRALEPLGLGIQLIHMRRTGSITTFFLLMAMTDARRFTDISESDTLRMVLDNVFSCLSDTGLRLIIRRLVCHVGELRRHDRHFRILRGNNNNNCLIHLQCQLQLKKIGSRRSVVSKKNAEDQLDEPHKDGHKDQLGWFSLMVTRFYVHQMNRVNSCKSHSLDSTILLLPY